MEKLPGALYYAPHDWMRHVMREVGSGRRMGPFYWREDSAPPSVWAAATWAPLWQINFTSIKDAARQLKELGTWWSPVFWTLRGKGKLIASELRCLQVKPRDFPSMVPNTALGAFTLLDEQTILACAAVNNPFPEANPAFVENKVDPPSSAYLKLQEALVRMNWYPGPQDRCLDAGACPGGWTWVLAKGGAQVEAIDRSPLDARVAVWPNVHQRQGNAFAYKPSAEDGYALIASDVICYPQALWDWFVELEAKQASRRYVLTIKMQKEPDWDVVARFQAVPGARVYHGAYNKHELTCLIQR
jgi:23S rRNA (cytidine2498-2'-O)-methyltransferase